MKYLLTVVIPTYNRANDLKECLSYVVPQVLPLKDKVHIYISDNASTDNTKEVVKGVSDSNPGIINYFCQKENLTASPNFNDAVHRVESEYIYMLSDDDFLVPECIPFLLKCIEENPEIEYFYLNQFVADEDMNGVYAFNKNFGKDYIKVYDKGADLIREHFDGPSCISSNMFKKEVWVNAANDIKQDCDGYVWLSILYQGVIDRKSIWIKYPMFTARMPIVARYAKNWPWYYIKGLGQLFKYLDVKSPGIYNAWINYQQRENRRQFLMVLTSVAYMKKLYCERGKEMKVHINSMSARVFYTLLITVVPGWFADKVLRNVIWAAKIFQYI